MKEIKFRAWTKIQCYELVTDKENGGSKWISKEMMCEVSSIHTKKKTVRLLYEDAKGYKRSTNKKFDEIKLMQYTGLNDVNDNEIYEGDLLKIVNDDINNITTDIKLNDIVEVYFNDGCYFVRDKFNNQEHLYTLHHLSKIVGNIYENKKSKEK